MSIKPARLDLSFPQGDDYALTISFVDIATAPINYTGHTFTAKLKQGSTSVSFAVNVTSIATGVLVLSLTDDQTILLPTSLSWNLQKVDLSGNKDTLIRGSVSVLTDEAP